jgi:uncharacterized membrane protein
MYGMLYFIIRIILSLLFLYSGISKILEPAVFATLIEAYGFVPENMTLTIAVILAILEILAGTGLLFDIQGSLATISGLMLLFIAVLSYGIWMGLEIDCGCFGPADPESKAFHGLRSALVRDFIMLIGIAYLYIYRNSHSLELRTLPLTYLKIAETDRT